jgi:hypothetical protein
MPLRADAGPRQEPDPEVLLIMVPGMGMGAADFHSKGLIAAVRQRGWPVAIAVVDPSVESYLDDSAASRLLDGIAAAQRGAGPQRVWLAGISLGCRAILRSVRIRPDVAEGVMLLTPYLASTGLIAQVERSGGLQRWAGSNLGRSDPDREFLAWLATAPPSDLPLMLVGRALGDRFAMTATLLADMIPAARLLTVPGEHDWTSWTPLWRLMLDQDPFRQPAARAS